MFTSYNYSYEKTLPFHYNNKKKKVKLRTNVQTTSLIKTLKLSSQYKSNYNISFI